MALGRSRVVPFSRYVTLTSSGSQQYFPSNNTSEFRNKLLSEGRVNLDPLLPLEVALCDLWYFARKQSGKRTIFGHNPSDNEITLDQHLESSMNVYRAEGETFYTTQNVINEQFEKFNPKLKMLLDVKKGEMRFLFENGDLPYKVEIPQNYAHALGFSVNVFEQKETLATNAPNQAELEAIDILEPIRFKIFKDIVMITTVNEPTTATAGGLVAAINEAVKVTSVRFHYDGVQLVALGITGQGYRIRFSTLLERIFGLASPFWFDYQSPSSTSVANIDLDLHHDNLLVLTDVTESQDFKCRPVRYLGVFSTPEVKEGELSMIHESPTTLRYFPVKTNGQEGSIDEIQIKLCYEDLSLVPAENDRHTMVTLHFRNRTF